MASQNNTSIIKFADDTTVIGLITGGDETVYSIEVTDLAKWCQDNNLFLNIIKTDYHRSTEEEEAALNVVTEDLTWPYNTTQLVKKSHVCTS